MSRKPKEQNKSIYFLDRVSHVREIFIFGGNPLEGSGSAYKQIIGRIAGADGDARQIVRNFVETEYVSNILFLKKGDSLSYDINEISITNCKEQRKTFTMK